MTRDLVVIAEAERQSLSRSTMECVEEARKVADALQVNVEVLLPGFHLPNFDSVLAAHGADSLTVVEHETLERFSSDGWLSAVTPLIRRLRPVVVIEPDTSHARAWLPRLALRLQTPVVGGCSRLGVDDRGNLVASHSHLGGALEVREVFAASSMLLVTLREGSAGLGAPLQPGKIDTRTDRPEIDEDCIRDRTTSYVPADPRKVDIREADRIVAGGLGLGGPAGVELLWKVADRLGAAVAGSRPVVDRGWLEAGREVGATGKTVAPKLYVAVGISGATQHTSGMIGSERVIAINRDPTAPILGFADLAVVGDLHQVLPEVVRLLAGSSFPDQETRPAIGGSR